MEVYHLRYFVAVAEQLNFSEAARRLHMATSPLSRRVRDLERELGTALFERDSHHVRLTEAGAALLPLAKEILGRVDDIPWRLRQATGEEPVAVLVGVPPGLHTRLRERLRELECRCAGRHTIRRWPGVTDDLVRGVERGELALALARLPVHGAGLAVREVFSEPLGALLPAAEFGSRTSVSLAELRDHAYVLPAPGTAPAYFRQIDEWLSSAGIKKRVQLKSADYASVGEIIAGGSAFAVSMLDPESTMQKYRDEQNVMLPFSDFRPALATGLVWRSDRFDQDADVREVVERAQEIFMPPFTDAPA
ncbi:LysR family transcriptional regulator [Sphaerisporangium fuscum]|uniref:LysR family transcriptional regulator n=1 Tax=Sphaerisporangium fuscum TaxID=2835868 RepID=UPI001BDC10AE|nr:LysR family transcriptional regulator [Sphaerisporangium fuscum]